MYFQIIFNVNIAFTNYKFAQEFYITIKVLITTQLVEIIKKKNLLIWY